MSSDHTSRPSVVLGSRQRWAVTIGLLLGIFLAALEATVISTAMPTVVASLGGLDRYSWVFSAYLLTSTASVPLWGRLSDLYGRRRLYLLSIALFLVGSMLAGASRSMSQLVICRAVQGLGAGGLIPLALTVIGEIYTLAERTRMQAVFSSVWGVSSIAGPLVGGFITDVISWRWVFYLNLPVGLVAAGFIHFALPEHAADGRGHTVDWLGGILLFVSTTLLLVAFSEGSASLSGERALWGASAVAAFIAFVYVERRAADPILPVALFQNRTVLVAAAIGFLAGMTLFGTVAFIPLFMQLTTGGSATSAGQILTPLYLTWVLASIVAARLLLRIGARASAVAGSAAVFVSSALLPWLAVGSSRAALFVDVAIMGAGLGFALFALLLSVQHSVLRSELGVATSFNMFARTIGGAAGVAMMGALLTAGLGGALRLSPAALEQAGLAGLSPEIRQRLIGALQRAFVTGAVSAGMGFVVAFWVPPFSQGVKVAAADDLMAAEISAMAPEAEPIGIDD